MVTAPRLRMLTVKEVAVELNVHPYTVRQMLHDGRLCGTKLRTHWRVKREDLDKFIKENDNKER